MYDIIKRAAWHIREWELDWSANAAGMAPNFR